MKKLLGKKTKRQKEGFFPEKLYKILKNNRYKSIIHWDKEGKIVVIENKAKFSKNILDKKFGHNNYDSFVRQLNLYGFEKLPNIEKSETEKFFLENFSKNKDIEDIKAIKRKKINTLNTPNIVEEKQENKENEKIIDEFLNEINKEKNDLSIIEKYKSLINNEEIILNKKLIMNVIKYITEKKEEIKNNINNNIKEINELITLNHKEIFNNIKNNFESLDIINKKQKSETTISRKSDINKKDDFEKPNNLTNIRKSCNNILNNNNYNYNKNNLSIKFDKIKDMSLKGSLFSSINSNDSDIFKINSYL